MKREFLIGFSIAILMLCILMSGCYESRRESSEEFIEGVESLRLNIQDASSTTQEDGADFLTTDAFLKAEQTGGDPIDWSDHTIYCEVTDSDDRKELVVLKIASTAFDPETNHESKTGDIIILGVGTDGDFSNGDYVDITIVEGIAKVYSQKSIRVV